MCLTVPQRVVEVYEGMAKMQDGRWVKTTMVGKVTKGDMLLVQANLAVEKISARRVQAMKQIMEV
jgi:hydrogenase maturation factor